MLETGKTIRIVAGCIAWLTLSAYARAEHFDFKPGMGDPFNPNLGSGDGRPYDWYYQGIALDYGGGFTDGRENTNYRDDPNGNIPYFTFDGTDKSSVGHCLQIVFSAPNSDSMVPYPVRNLRFSYTDSNGSNEVAIVGASDVGSPSSYNVVRMWIQNTGSGLYWRTKIADLDGNGGSWNQSATMNIWRLEKSQADCTTNARSANPALVFVTFIGTTGNYRACRQDGSCTWVR